MKRFARLFLTALVATGIAVLALAVHLRGQVRCDQTHALLRLEQRQAWERNDLDAMLALTERLLACESERGTWYNRACALARSGRPEEALHALRRSVDLGWDRASFARDDVDFVSLRGRAEFEGILTAAERNFREGVGPIAPAPRLEGVRTVEGFPPGGFRYRLHLPLDASPGTPARLLVWLHPSDSLATELIEPLAPDLAARGFALLVPTQKFANYWTAEDGARLYDVTVPAIASHGVRTDRFAVIGFSAGGQNALAQWLEGRRFAGMVLDSAFPIANDGDPAMPDLSKAPKDPVPMLVLFGEREGHGGNWRRARTQWRERSRLLEIHEIAGGGHEWFFDEPGGRTLLYDWLARLAWEAQAPPQGGPR